jgi:hypothetical protein
MATITSLETTDNGSTSRTTINTNFSNLNSDKAETSDIPVKATGSELNTGTDDAKFATAKALADSNYIKYSDVKSAGSTSDASSITPTGNYPENEYYVTALAQALTINAPSGTASNGNTLLLRIKDNGTARSLTWNTIYTFIGTTKPTTTVAGKILYVGAIYNSTATKWEVISINQEA